MLFRKKKFRSFSKRIRNGLLIFICINTGLFVYSSFNAQKKLLITNVDVSLDDVIKNKSEIIALNIQKHLDNLDKLSYDSEILSGDWERQKKVLDLAKLKFGYPRMTYVSTDGMLRTTDGVAFNVKGSPPYNAFINGKNHIGDPMFSKADNTVIFPTVIPIFDKDNKTVLGGVATDLNFGIVYNTLNTLDMGEHGFSQIINSKGDLVSTNLKVELDKTEKINLIEASGEGSVYSNLMKEVIREKTGNKRVILGNGENLVKYSQIEGTDWIVVSHFPIMNLNKTISALLTKQILLGFGLIFAGLVFVWLINIVIKKKIKSTTKLTDEVNKNIIKKSQELVGVTDEFEVINKAVIALVNKFFDTIKDIRKLTKNIVKTSNKNDKAIASVSGKVNTALFGSEEITASIEEMGSTIYENKEKTKNLSDFTNDVAKEISTASELAENNLNKAHSLLVECNLDKKVFKEKRLSHEKDFSEKIADIETLSDISNMAIYIKDISKRTHTLALNASIEATRAGEYGKGFSVVAQQVKLLAEESSKKSQDIERKVEEVFAFIEMLSSSTSELLESTGETMDGAHNKMVDLCTSYIDGSLTFKDNMNIIANRNLEIEKLASDIDTDMDNLGSLSNEITNSLQEITESISDIYQEVLGVESDIQGVSGFAEKLSENVSGFDIVE